MRTALSAKRRDISLLLGFVLAFASAASIAAQDPQSQNKRFLEIVRSRLIAANHLDPKRRETIDAQLQKICPFETKPAARTVLYEYGAVYTGADTFSVPPKCVFLDEAEVQRFQAAVKVKSAIINGAAIELQEAAMDALLAAQAEAQAAGLQITPADGPIAGRRSYKDTAVLWYSRFEPAIRFWTAKERITPEEAETVKTRNVYDLIEKVREWENAGLFFGLGQASSIFRSVAPPGTSQHLAMLAVDVNEHKDPQIRLLLAKNGWFQTVKGDMPHFTYLGVPESQLPTRGLQFIIYNDRGFWVPATETDFRSTLYLRRQNLTFRP